jgi:hypothetical protein
MYPVCPTNRDSAFDIATGYRLDDRWDGVRVPVMSRILSSPTVQTGSGVHPTSYLMGNGGSLPRVKRQGREADHLPPTSAPRNRGSIHPLPHTPTYFYLDFTIQALLTNQNKK